VPGAAHHVSTCIVGLRLPQIVLPSEAALLVGPTGLYLPCLPPGTSLSIAEMDVLKHLGVQEVPPLQQLLKLCTRRRSLGILALEYLVKHIPDHYSPM
jgi:hypothetical protein